MSDATNVHALTVERLNISAVYLEDGYKPSRGLTGWYRDLTVGEAKKLAYGRAIYAVDWAGKVREVRLNGAPKVWKRSPGCELSLKYGLRDCFRVGDKDRPEGEPIGDKVRIVVPLKQQFAKDTPVEIVDDYLQEHGLNA